ncbi:MAG: DUF899 family protein [Pseudonocardiaceae bacterium]
MFDSRRQLIVDHHRLKPGDDDPCSGCSMVVDNFCHLAHLHARDTSLVVVPQRRGRTGATTWARCCRHRCWINWPPKG